MQVSDTQHFVQLGNTFRYVGGRELIGLFPFPDCSIHIALIRFELRQSVMCLNGIEMRLRCHLDRIGQHVFKRLDPLWQRLLSDSAHLLQILLPSSRFQKLLEQHIGQDLPRHVGWVPNRPLACQMKIAVRTHALSRSALFRSTAREPPRWPGLFLRFAQQLQDDETGRHLHDGADLLRLERFDHGPQFWAQRRNFRFADVPAVARVWIDGHLCRDRGELLSSFEPFESFLRLGLGVHHDYLQVHCDAGSRFLGQQSAKSNVRQKQTTETDDQPGQSWWFPLGQFRLSRVRRCGSR